MVPFVVLENLVDCSERGLVTEGGGAARGPRVVRGAAGGGVVPGLALAAVAALLAVDLASVAGLAGDLGVGVAQGGADLIYLRLHDCALFSVSGGVGALGEAALDDDTRALGE